MAIETDPERRGELSKVVGKRLRAARKSAGMSQAQAAESLKHRGITQVSLAESGERLPPLLDMLKYADLYSVPMDFLIGRTDDPIAEADELGQGLVVRAIGSSVSGLFQRFSTAVAEVVGVMVSNHRKDRSDLMDMIPAGKAAEQALARMRELNPEYEDLRGGATLESALMRIAAISKRAEARTLEEQRQVAMIDKVLHLESIDKELIQFTFQFSSLDGSAN